MLTVIQANTKRDLTKLADVKAELGLNDRDSDVLIKRHITRASDIIAKYCNRVFAIETVAETFRVGSNANGLTLSRYPVVEVISILDGDRLVGVDQYEMQSESGILDRIQSDRISIWPAGKSVITYRAGFELPGGLPFGIERAAILLVKHFLYSGDRDPAVRSEVVEGAGTTDYFGNDGSGLSPEIRGLLEPHVKPNG